MESQSGSPGFGVSLQLQDCIEELLRFTLVSSIEGSLEVDISLSKEYCTTLLQHDPSNPFPISSGLFEGVPSYPLYKQLAASLYHAISSEALPQPQNKVAALQECSSLKQKEEEWVAVMREKGSDLLNVLKSVDFELHVQEPYFSLLKNGQKTIEGRCAVGHYNKIEPGSYILFNKCLILEVQHVHHYHSFHEMLEVESLKEVLPGVDTAEKGVQVYRQFYSEEKEKSNGVLAICVKKLDSQPYIYLGSLLSGLSYAGVQRLLGFVYTVGTVSEALPPPASTLISSFLLPHNPNAKGSTLTDGARALSKHVNRSSDGHWGSFTGSDSEKNRIAVDVISNIITRCCWMNVHVVPPHGAVFEIRVADSYGARWSKDGTKFIGFLEPYMEDGHSKGWRH